MTPQEGVFFRRPPEVGTPLANGDQIPQPIASLHCRRAGTKEPRFERLFRRDQVEGLRPGVLEVFDNLLNTTRSGIEVEQPILTRWEQVERTHEVGMVTQFILGILGCGDLSMIRKDEQ